MLLARVYLDAEQPAAPRAEWLALRGDAYLGRGDPAAAEAACTRAAEHATDRWQAYLRRAEARLDGGNPDGARSTPTARSSASSRA